MAHYLLHRSPSERAVVKIVSRIGVRCEWCVFCLIWLAGWGHWIAQAHGLRHLNVLVQIEIVVVYVVSGWSGQQERFDVRFIQFPRPIPDSDACIRTIVGSTQAAAKGTIAGKAFGRLKTNLSSFENNRRHFFKSLDLT